MEESLESGHCCETRIVCCYEGALEMVANGQLTGGDVESVVRNFDAEKWCKDPYTNSLTPTIWPSVCRRSRQLTSD